MKPAFSICVYCGSRPGARAPYSEAAKLVGQWIGQHGGQLVYGGGRNGLMGTVADATLAAGGQVIGRVDFEVRGATVVASNAAKR